MKPPTGDLDSVPGVAARPAAGTIDLAELTSGWLRRWSPVPPVGELLAGARPDRMVQLRGLPHPDAEATGRAARGRARSPRHALPTDALPADASPDGAAGGPATVADECRAMLIRYNTVLDRLFGGRHVYVVSGEYTDVDAPAGQSPPLAGMNPDAVHWLRLLGRDASAYHDRALDLFAVRRPWLPGSLDRLLLAATAGLATNVMIMDVGLYRIVHPHPAGIDLLLTGPAERDEFRLDYPGWLTRR